MRLSATERLEWTQMRHRNEVVSFIKAVIGRQMLALRQGIKSQSWPAAYEVWLTGLEANMRQAGYDEDTIGVPSLSAALVELVEEAARE